MGLESNPQWVVDLNRLWPLGTDQKRYGDDNIRNLKLVLQNSFGGFAAGVWVTGTDGGVVNAYTVNPAVLPPSLGAKMTVVFSPVVTNTGACTLNYAGLGVKALKSVSGADLVAGDLVLGSIYAAFYTGTEYRLLSITKNYADQLAFSAALPAIPAGNVFRGLYGYGGTASFRTEPFVRIPRTSNTALDETVGGCLIDITSGTFTQTAVAIASLPVYWFCWYENSGSGTVTLSLGANIDGYATRRVYPGERIKLFKDETAAAYRVHVEKAFYMKTNGPSADYNFVAPSGYAGNLFDIDGIGGGGGAGSGRKGSAGSARQGGSPGGAPGRVRRTVQITPDTTIAVAHGAAGTAGVSQTVDNTDGNAGTAGGNSTFGTMATAYGGCAGVGGAADSSLAGHTSGSGSLSAGASAWEASTSTKVGGNPTSMSSTWSAVLGATPNASHDEGGAGVYAFSLIGNSVYGGAAAASGDTSGTTPAAGGNSQYGVAGGGWGGSVTSGNAVMAGGAAGKSGDWTTAGAAGGTSGASPTAGANGTAGTTDLDAGNPGGGGGSTATAGVNGGRGGDGAGPGAPGGGGGACTNGAGNSGAGGTSQPGQWIITGRLK